MRLINIMRENGAVLDSSDTGTGKTYAACAACKYMNKRMIVVCPKSVISTWRRISKEFGNTVLTITNYETIKGGKCYNTKHKKVVCRYVDKELNWSIPKDVVLIFDEAHRCRHFHTDNSRLILAAKETGNPMMLLSATLADSPENFLLFSYLLNFIDPVQVESEKIDRKQYLRIMHSWLTRDKKPMVRIHGMLFPNRASRIRIDDLGKLFPETQIEAQIYDVSEQRAKEIQQHYDDIAEGLDTLNEKKLKDKQNPLVRVLRAHQKIELLKVPIFVEMANDLLFSKYSIVIFVNFTKTLKVLAKMLHTNCIIYGEQTAEERERNIEDFQENRKRVVVCNIAAGGVGISLHDLYGGHPRASLLSPTWSSTHLKQALGRIHRAGGKTKSIQRIIYVAQTVEENIADKIRRKLKDLNSINNGDLDLTNIEYVRKRKISAGKE